MKQKMAKITALLLAVIMVVGCVPVVSTEAADGEKIMFNGHVYQFIEEAVTWNEAQKACKRMGGYLVTVNSKAENDFLLSNIPERCFWIGGYNIWGQLEWDTGEYVYYNNVFTNLGTLPRGYLAMMTSNNDLAGSWIALNSDGTLDIPIAASLGSMVSGFVCEFEIYPEGYDFETDSFLFNNITETIDKKYYQEVFGKLVGAWLYACKEKGEKHGHCFGMASVTAATLMYTPNIRNYVGSSGEQRQSLREVEKEDTISRLNKTAKEYIKCSFVYQLSSSIKNMKKDSKHKGIENVYNAVRNAVSNNEKSTGILIVFNNEHAVYATGVGNNEIFINDSNIPLAEQSLTKDGDSWSYISYSSDNGDEIWFVDDVHTVYNKLIARANSRSNIDTNTLGIVDTDKNLISASSDKVAFVQLEDMIEIDGLIGGESTEETTEEKLYWLDNTETVSATNTSDEAAEISVVGNYAQITADLPANAVAEITVNDTQPATAKFTVNKGDELSVTFTTLDENGEFVDVEVSGTASGETINATETDTGIAVEGFDSMTITYTDVDGTDEEIIKNADGKEVNITTDLEKNEVSTDYVCDHADNNADGLCDLCGYDFTKDCNHLCHKDGFEGFIWMIVQFFCEIFGINPTCSCGAAHY